VPYEFLFQQVDKGDKMKLLCSKKSHLFLPTIGFLLLFIAVYAAAPPTCESAESAEIKSSELAKLETRPGVKLKFIVIKPTNPVASVVLLEGGYGILQLGSAFGKPTVGEKRRFGFLTRTRKEFAKSGVMVALVDKPSDRQKIEADFRMSSEHAQDLKAVISHLKSEADVPIWLVGMSFGTVSAPNGAIRLKEEVDGLVLVSSVTHSRKKWPTHNSHPNVILDMDLDKITVPTLIVSHQDDKCETTPPSDAPKLKAALANSPKVEVMYFSGGKKPKSKPCRARSAHGFYGIEDEVVSAIVDFIKANSK
jgi:dienelactone hydrolase